MTVSQTPDGVHDSMSNGKTISHNGIGGGPAYKSLIGKTAIVTGSSRYVVQVSIAAFQGLKVI